MTRINADIFISSWVEFSQKFTTENLDWLELYESNHCWSEKFLGGKRSSSDNSPIGKFFADKFQGLRYRMEDGSFDLAFSFADNYKKIPYLNRNEISNFDLENQFYPSSYDILLEIENECVCAWQEMTKLTWARCPLKVLVTYNNKWSNENEMLAQSFTTIISQSNTDFKDNQETEYLLIIGNNADKKLNWTFYKFDSNGNRK
ncbi:MAG: hypothetical protein JSR97_05960 [Verrucomicrobia bacterium]|nr:hypothetical protein [Verrucomicrobiota bacterium]